MSYEDNARIINDDIFDLVNSCFELEKSTQNNEGRVNFFDTYKNYFVLTDDGSYSINSKEINHKIETLHTSTGAISESFEKFIKPMKFNYEEDIAILDICAGLGEVQLRRGHCNFRHMCRTRLQLISSNRRFHEKLFKIQFNNRYG